MTTKIALQLSFFLFFQMDQVSFVVFIIPFSPHYFLKKKKTSLPVHSSTDTIHVIIMYNSSSSSRFPRKSSPCFRTALLCLFLFYSTTTTNAYRMGEPVDTALAWDSQPAFLAQMPRFAIQSQSQIQVPSSAQYVTFSLEDGLWGLPAVKLTSSFERLVVQLVYSAGAIQAIHSEPVYRNELEDDSKPAFFTVEYRWIEEPHVTPEAGQTIMFLVVVAVSVWIVWTVLMSTDGSTLSSEQIGHSSFSAIPKYE